MTHTLGNQCLINDQDVHPEYPYIGETTIAQPIKSSLSALTLDLSVDILAFDTTIP